MALNVSLGHPGSAFSPSSSSARRPRHRGPADKEKGRQRVAAHQARQAHQDALESQQAAEQQVSSHQPAASAHQEILDGLCVASQPAVNQQDLLESQRVAAHQAAAFKATVQAHQATLESDKVSATTAPVMSSTFASVTARPSPIFKCDQCHSSFKNEGDLMNHIGVAHNTMRLYKTMYYTPKDPSPCNAPPPPECKSCKKATSWKASRTKSNKFWLHEYCCSACTDHTRTSTRTTITTPPFC